MGSYRIGIGKNGTEDIERGEMPVIVDVLRTSSTIVTALANGVEEIIPLKSIEDGFELRDRGYFLVGEYKGKKIGGFDCGNSPPELLENLNLKEGINKIALRSTNATDLLTDVSQAYICSSLNLNTIKDELKNKKANIIAVGSRHGLTEDLGLALCLYSSLNDGLKVNEDFLIDCISGSNTAGYLSEIGYHNDVEFICEIDKYDAVPVLKDGVIKNEY